MVIHENAPAKINLYLHVTGKRADGYHLLDSLVVFCTMGDAAQDRVEIALASSPSLVIAGPYGAALQQEAPADNLISKALAALTRQLGITQAFAVKLEKRLPIASGIGGGSADAAAALRGAARLLGLPLHHPALAQAATQTGADLLACLFSQPCYFGGIGDAVDLVSGLPPFALLLVNPGLGLNTAAVFKARSPTQPFTPPARLPAMPATAEALAKALITRHNDLTQPATQLCPSIASILESLNRQPGCLLARLSGSGATCFGVFADSKKATEAATHLAAENPDGWLAVTEPG